MVVVKDTWPPNEPKNVEAIAASFVPPAVCLLAETSFYHIWGGFSVTFRGNF